MKRLLEIYQASPACSSVRSSVTVKTLVVHNKDGGILFYWLMLECTNWKVYLVVFRKRGLILMNLNRESRVRSVQQEQDLG